MKLAQLLAQYLYEYKTLPLPGIGRFLLDPSVEIEFGKGRHQKPADLTGIRFEQDAQQEEEPELIGYLSTHSGKIKALAAADLHSHLELARQFLNIGKPFLLEGIGSLNKSSSGEYLFTAGQALAEKAELPAHAIARESTLEEPATDYKGLLYTRKEKKGIPPVLLLILILGGLALAIWGGYRLYMRNAEKESAVLEKVPAVQEVAQPVPATPVAMDSLPSPAADTTKVPTSPATGMLKFILERSGRERALARYSRLRTFQWDVQMETTDSVEFNIFMLLPVAAADSSRVLDSLSRLNGKRVWVER